MASLIKIKRSSVQGKTPTTGDITAGELALNTRDGKLYSSDGSVVFEIGANTTNLNVTNDLSVGGDISITGDIVPSANNTSDLGTDGLRFRDLYLSGSTLNLGGATLSSDGTGTLSISATGAVLPVGSKISDGATQAELATVSGTTGAVTRSVPLFTASGGLGTAANTFTFKVNNERKVFTAFTLGNGSALEDADVTLFSF